MESRKKLGAYDSAMEVLRIFRGPSQLKPHATARGLQPPACCGKPAMWCMAKRLHRVISARVVAKWSILVERGAG